MCIECVDCHVTFILRSPGGCSEKIALVTVCGKKDAKEFPLKNTGLPSLAVSHSQDDRLAAEVTPICWRRMAVER